MGEKIELEVKGAAKSLDTDDGCKDSDSDIVAVESTGGRETWGGQFEFVLSLIGYTVGLGNIWRFPYFVYRNGGGVAFIPFLLFLVFCGGPLYYIEVCLGQFSGKSPNGVWEICPLFKGIGFLMVTVSFTFVWYFGLCFGWAWYFLIQSFYPTLPWGTCGNEWNSDTCIDQHTNITDKMLSLNVSNGQKLTTASSEFWNKKVLSISPGIDEMGSLQLHIFGCVAIGWVVVFVCLLKGVQSLGKVVYVTATMPYLLLTILLIRGVTLDGASDGLKKYITPNFSKLLGSQIWIESAVQCFYSLGPAWGGVITMASFNKFNKPIVRDTILVCVADGFTGFYSGLVVFSILGFLSKETGVAFEDLPFSGASLAFIAYPEALSRLPLPQMWSVLFFITLVLVGVDTVFGTFETVSNYIIDFDYAGLHKYRTPINGALTTALIVLSLPLCMSGGYYIFMLFDWYVATFNIVVTALLEVVIVAWIYGATRFSADIGLMQGRPPHVLMRVLWCFIIPIFMVGILMTSIFNYSAPSFGKGGYSYPSFAVAIGNFVAFAPLVSAIVIAVFLVLREKDGSIMQRLRRLIKPSGNWAPNAAEFKQSYQYQAIDLHDNNTILSKFLMKS